MLDDDGNKSIRKVRQKMWEDDGKIRGYWNVKFVENREQVKDKVLAENIWRRVRKCVEGREASNSERGEGLKKWAKFRESRRNSVKLAYKFDVVD